MCKKRFFVILFYGWIISMAVSAWGNKRPIARPSKDQLAFQDLEFGVFFHYSIDAYMKDGSKPGQTSVSAFQPDHLDIDQWMRVAKSMGATFAILTARHEQGFCLWPTSTTDYSIKYSPYKNGHGDIVGEFVRACRKYGLRPGLYTAPWIDSHWDSIYAKYRGGDTGNIDKYNDPKVFKKLWNKERKQITELLTQYGPLTFIWDDHFGRSDVLGNKPFGGRCRELYRRVSIVAHQLQPHCLLLGRDVEHVGNEEGHASYPLWNSLNTIDGTIYTVSNTYHWGHDNIGNPDGMFYRSQIAPSTDAFSSGGWMWHGYRTPKSVKNLMNTYDETVGRGSVLILNLAPNPHGRIDSQIVVAARNFGNELKRRFEKPIRQSFSPELNQQFDFSGPTELNQIVSMEDLSEGQKISSYVIEAKINGEWKTLVQGQTIGHKKIDVFPRVKVRSLKFIVTGTVHPHAQMRSILLYDYNSECTHYYVDSRNGNDGNDGHSARQAWKNLKRIKNLKLYAGDQLLLRRGSVWHGSLTVCGNGTPKDSVIVGAYGKGPRPKVIGEEHSPFAVQVRNSNDLTVQNLEIVNKGKERLAGRCGIEVLDDENGISRQVHLRSLYIHDVNGTLAKHSGEGCGILIKREWKKIPSAFDGLVIEDCIIQRCERNGITWDGGWDRKRWFPDIHTIVRRNLIEEVPGDGIVPIGCDGVVVEYNLMRNCTGSLPDAAAGMWPWSCDNAVFQYNEVSGHHAPWDGQGFDSDFNCRNTVIQYNYSHDNDGGFLLICNPGPSEAKDNIGNLNTLVQYNLSINDGLRTKSTSQGMFSPVIHVAGPCENAMIRRNILYLKKKTDPLVDSNMLTSDSWGGYCDGLTVKQNVFYAEQKSEIKLNKSTHNWFENNFYLGKMKKPDINRSGKTMMKDSSLHSFGKPLDWALISHFLRRKRIAGGEAEMWVVNMKAMNRFFQTLFCEK